MTTHDDNDYKTGRQGTQWMALLTAAEELGKEDIGNLTDAELEEIRDRAGVESLKSPKSIRDNLKKAKLLYDLGLLERFKGSVYDYDQHPAYFVKLAKYQPGWCDILLQRGVAPDDMTEEQQHGERRMKYEMLVSLADHEEVKAAAKAMFPADDLPSGWVTLAVKLGDGFKPVITMRKNFFEWLYGPKK